MSPLQRLYHYKVLTAGQVILLRLYTNDGSGVPPTSLSRSTGVPLPTVSMATKALLSTRLIERFTLYRDQRVSLFRLTDEGRAESKRIQDIMTDYVDDIKKRESWSDPSVAPASDD